MKRFILLAIFMVLMVGAAQAANYDYTAQVYKQTVTTTGDVVLTEVNTGITFKVLTVNSDTAATITKFADSASTSVTNPVTAANFALATVCNGKVRFRSTAASHDLIVTDTSGMYTAFVEGFTVNDHKIVIDERPGTVHTGTIWFSASSAAETDTGVDFLAHTLILTVQPEIVTVDATETIDIGLLSSETAGDADGLIDGASVATAGFPLTTLTTSGTLMDDGTNFDPDGHVVTGSNATSLTYTGSTGSDTAAGYIHVLHLRLR